MDQITNTQIALQSNEDEEVNLFLEESRDKNEFDPVFNSTHYSQIKEKFWTQPAETFQTNFIDKKTLGLSDGEESSLDYEFDHRLFKPNTYNILSFSGLNTLSEKETQPKVFNQISKQHNIIKNSLTPSPLKRVSKRIIRKNKKSVPPKAKKNKAMTERAHSERPKNIPKSIQTKLCTFIKREKYDFIKKNVPHSEKIRHLTQSKLLNIVRESSKYFKEPLLHKDMIENTFSKIIEIFKKEGFDFYSDEGLAILVNWLNYLEKSKKLTSTTLNFLYLLCESFPTLRGWMIETIEKELSQFLSNSFHTTIGDTCIYFMGYLKARLQIPHDIQGNSLISICIERLKDSIANDIRLTYDARKLLPQIFPLNSYEVI